MKKYILTPWTAVITLILLVCLRMLDPSLVESIRLRYFDTLIANTKVLPSENVVIANIDDQAIQKFGQFPFPRKILAGVVDELYQKGASLVVLNILMSEPDRFNTDQSLLNQLKQHPVILSRVPDTKPLPGMTVEQSKEYIEASKLLVRGPPPLPKHCNNTPAGVSILGDGIEKWTVRYNGVLNNLPMFEDCAAGSGIANTFPEIDGVTRRLPMIIMVNGRLLPNVALETLRVVAGDPSFQVKVSETGIQAIRIPKFKTVYTDSNSRIWLAWNTKFEEFSVSQIPAIKDKIVIVGVTAAGLGNPVGTSVGAKFPHHLQGTIIDTLTTGTNITRPDWASGAEILSIIFISIVLLFLTRWTYIGLVSVIVFSVGAAYGSYFVFNQYLWLFDITALICSIILVSLHAYGVKFISEFLQKQQIKKQFGTYLSPDLVAQLQRQPELLQLGGDEKELSIMFTDVRGFTTISEHYGKDVQGLTKIMNRYMTAMTKKILENKGTLDKYIGDAQMAFWNAPIENVGHAKLAVKTALEMMESLDEFNKEITAEGIPPFGMGLGINTGTVVVGNMGSDQRFDYTCLGDAVNTASRLEGQSKNYGVRIVLGPETAKQVKDDYDVFEMDCIAVKGKTEGVKIYTLGKQSEAQNAFLFWYYEGKWEESIRIAKQQISAKSEMSEYYTLMLERLDQGKPKDWNGVYKATSK